MKYSSQNLSYGKHHTFWHGRGWLHGEYTNPKARTLHWEWAIGKFARDFAATLTFGNGDDDAGVLLHLCLPWLFSIFVGVDRVYRCKECACGVAIHNGGIWFYPLSYRMDLPAKTDPWYRHHYFWHFPWDLDWHSTEILAHEAYGPKMAVVWGEYKGSRIPFLDTWDERQSAAKWVSKDYPYAYILKNREVQKRTATVYVERREWRARWWPIIPIRKVSTCIDVKFDKEVGEETGSWKGGCTGCGYEMKWGETPERCLSRMEHEREFRR